MSVTSMIGNKSQTKFKYFDFDWSFVSPMKQLMQVLCGPLPLRVCLLVASIELDLIESGLTSNIIEPLHHLFSRQIGYAIFSFSISMWYSKIWKMKMFIIQTFFSHRCRLLDFFFNCENVYILENFSHFVLLDKFHKLVWALIGFCEVSRKLSKCEN